MQYKFKFNTYTLINTLKIYVSIFQLIILEMCEWRGIVGLDIGED
jgi:hypothetical protein